MPKILLVMAACVAAIPSGHKCQTVAARHVSFAIVTH